MTSCVGDASTFNLLGDIATVIRFEGKLIVSFISSSRDEESTTFLDIRQLPRLNESISADVHVYAGGAGRRACPPAICRLAPRNSAAGDVQVLLNPRCRDLRRTMASDGGF